MTQEKKNYTLPIVVMFFLFAMISKSVWNNP